MEPNQELERSFIEKIRTLDAALFRLVETYVDGMLAATKTSKKE